MESWERSQLLAERAARHVAKLQHDQAAAIARAVLSSSKNLEVAAAVGTRLEALEPIAAETLTDAQRYGYLQGARIVSALMPREVQDSWQRQSEIRNYVSSYKPPPSGPKSPGAGETGPPKPAIRFPQIDRGAAILAALTPLTPGDYDAMSDQARRTAFTVARAQTIEAVEAVQEAVVEDIRGRGNLKSFRKVVGEALDGALSPSQTETIYRTYTSRGYSAGQIAVWDNPLIRSEVPYVLYSATHDSRVRPEHLAMEKLGLNKTAVYRADDPIWNEFWPPWAWNCRCFVIPLDIYGAAERGVREAKEWLRSGRPPLVPEFVQHPNFSPPRGWVPSGRALSPVY